MKIDNEQAKQIIRDVADVHLLSRRKAAERLDVHPSWIDKLCQRGELKKITLGRRCARITLQSIDDYISREASK